MRKRICLLTLALLLCLCQVANAEGLEDGLYTVNAESNASMFRIVKCVLRVEDGGLTAVLTMSGQGYGYVYPGTAAEAESAPQEDWIPFELNFDGQKTFALPIPALDVDVNVAAWSIKYEKWYDRVLRFHSDSVSVYAEIAPEGKYDGMLLSDTALDGAAAVLSSADGEMNVELDAGDVSALRIAGSEYAAEDGKLSFPLPSLDERLDVEVQTGGDWTQGWLKLKSAGLAEHSESAGDGVYSIDVSTDSGLLKFTGCTLTVRDGNMTALLTAAKNDFDFVYAGTAAEALADEAGRIPAVPDADGAYTYELEVPGLDTELPLATFSARANRWYDRSLTFDSATLTPLEAPVSEDVEATDDAENADDTASAGSEGTVDAAEAILADGEYVPDSFSFSGGTGKVTIECPAVRVADGEVTATLVFSSSKYTWVKVDGVEYDGIATEESTQFEIPVRLNEDMTISAQTIAMSQPHEVEYVIHIELNSGEGDNADPRALAGLVHEGSMALDYATGFSVDYYEGGYALIDIVDGDRFLLIPDGKGAPEGIDSDIIPLRRPIQHIYLAATSAMALFDSLDALDSVRLSSLRPADWYVENAAAAMEAGDMLYGGKYSEPDYELLITEHCDLAIESTMIYHSPEVKEMIELLGIPVLVERASYEPHPLGRSEWIRLYGLLTGHEAEAEAFMQAQVAAMAQLDGFENTQQSVAFFYISSDGAAVVRSPSDYVPKMIELAGGKYIFSDLDEGDSHRSTLSISMEDFYDKAVNADYLVYNASIDEPLGSIDELLSKSELFADFKAVREGRVYCTGKYLYQATDIVADTILDFHKMLTGRDDELSFIYRLS